MNGRLQGRTALVTGGSRGVGRAIALALAGEGANVVVNYRERARDAAEVVAEIERLGEGGDGDGDRGGDRDRGRDGDRGARSIAVQGDVTEREQVRALLAAALDTFGGLDILVNNAGLLQQKPFADITDADWDRVLAVNLKGAFLCSQEAHAQLRRSGHGRILNISSSGGQLGGPLAPHYSAAKAGTIALTRSLARLLAPEVAVNCISPGLVETDMTREEIASAEGHRKLAQIPLGRVGSAHEVAAAAVFLAASAPYITGHTLNVNGGLYLG
ncbi:MAG TPA: 3-oxoacyl-ACP reductase family protein [Solirubrobacteraceae bacterium]|jgi:NAD(P)-dependent dehydrogenase (short-subunit alcohol dehydrogenase family)